MLTFDKKKFLSLPLNNGKHYWDFDTGCGCVKGIFNESLETPLVKKSRGPGLGEENGTQVGSFRDIYGDPICDIQNPELGIYPTRLANGNLNNKKLQNILDIGEYILLRGYPQKAKLYVVEMLEKFNLVEFAKTEEKELAGVK